MYVGNRGEYPFDSYGWDTTHVGFIYTTPEKAKECLAAGENLSIDEVNKIDEVLKQEVKTYASYLEGDVVGYVVEDENNEVIDSCWGFVGYELDELYEQAKYSVDDEVKKNEKEAREVQKWAERDVITV